MPLPVGATKELVESLRDVTTACIATRNAIANCLQMARDQAIRDEAVAPTGLRVVYRALLELRKPAGN